VTRSGPVRADNAIHAGAAHPARYDQVADRYVAEVGDRLDDEGTAALLDLVGDVDDQRLLDIACGKGRVSRELARRSASVTALDLSAELVQQARTDAQIPGNEIHYEVADICDSDVLAGSKFDGIVCNFGASDIDDLNGMLSSVRRLLSPGGFFVLSLLHPCFPGWPGRAPSACRPELATSTKVGGRHPRPTRGSETLSVPTTERYPRT